MQRLDTSEAPEWFAATVYGKSGSGKTSLAVTAPRPLVLLTERQGMLSIRQTAKRLGVPVPATIFIESLDDCRAVLRALRGPRTEPFRVLMTVYDGDGAPVKDPDTGKVKRELTFELPVEAWPETVVIDTVTDLMRLVENEIRSQSPQKTGKDGLPVDSERYWNVLGDRAKLVLYGFRDAPVHKLFLCQEDDRETGEGDEKRRSLGPAMPMRKLPALLSGAGNLTAYAYRREVRERKEGEKEPTVRVRYGVMTTGPEFMLLKPCRPLRDVEVADYGLWIKAVHGALTGPMPAAPAPSGESLAVAVGEADLPIEGPAERLAEAGKVAGKVADAMLEDAVAAVSKPAATRKKRSSK